MKKDTTILISLFIIWGVLSRTVFHLGPNVEFVSAISISSGILLKNKKLAFSIPVIIMFISDLIIGNTNIFLFTWTGFAIPVVIGFFLSKFIKKDNEHKLTKLIGLSGLAGITSSITFFVWTNFGHWITTNMYSKDLNGLIACYINAIPFLKPQLAGNLIIVPIFVLVTYFVFNLSYKANTKLDAAKTN